MKNRQVGRLNGRKKCGHAIEDQHNLTGCWQRWEGGGHTDIYEGKCVIYLEKKEKSWSLLCTSDNVDNFYDRCMRV